jgi:hypothetical protein
MVQLFLGRHNIQYNDTLHNGIKHNGTQHNYTLNTTLDRFVEGYYAEY